MRILWIGTNAIMGYKAGSLPKTIRTIWGIFMSGFLFWGPLREDLREAGVPMQLYGVSGALDNKWGHN